MTEQATLTMSETIDVDIDRDSAFQVFTEEFDQWWGNGPIDAWDSSRVLGHRIEPGVGGRVLELYPDDELVLGTMTVWEPPERLAWTTGDGVRIDITFEELTVGSTRVTVVGTAESVAGAAGLAVVRMAPQWFPRHVARRAAGETLRSPGRLNLVLRYREPAATGRWLVDAFGFLATADLPDTEPVDPEQTWIELRTGAGESGLFLWLLEPGDEVRPGDHLPWVYVDDLDAHLAHAEQAGATIVSPIVHHGFRSYTAADREGRHWLFAQAPPALRGS